MNRRDLLPSVNDHIVKLELESLTMMNRTTGKFTYHNALRCYVRTETSSGRTKWVQVFGPLIGTTDDDGTTRDSLTYAELLRCAANVFEKMAAGDGVSEGVPE